MKLVVGLGNPGTEYLKTRHNVGFLIADALAESRGERIKKPLMGGRSATCSFRLAGNPVAVMKPLTYMNESGTAVKPFMKRKKLKASDIIVVFDDVDLKFGDMRIREKGGAGGHNGLKSLIHHLGTDRFVRLRVGVGPRPHGSKLVDYVLGEWDRDEEDGMPELRDRAVGILSDMLIQGVAKAMNKHN